MGRLTHWEGEPVHVWERLWGVPLVEAHDVLGSTNDRARDLARDGAGPYAVVVAREQSAGRGRSGSSWHSAADAGLWISALLPLHAGLPAHLPLVVGLAAAEAIEESCPGLRVGIKWPNDLEIQGRKAGGVLCEHAYGRVVAGVGLNVSQRPGDFPEDIAHRAVSLETAVGRRVSLGGLATALIRALRRRYPLHPGPLPDTLHAELVSRDVLLGRRVLTQQAGPGIARGIDPEGALLLEREGGPQVRVVAGSVRPG